MRRNKAEVKETMGEVKTNLDKASCQLYTYIMVTFNASKLRSLIKKSGLSYRKLALEMQKKTGAFICWETIRKLAEGITTIPLTDTSIIIADFFGIDIKDWYIDKED